MRLTVGKKIIVGIATVILVATLALLVVYGGLSRVVQSMRQLAEVQEPSHSAALEVEINVNEIVFAVFAYLDGPDPRHREMVRKDQQDVAAFHARFLQLADSERERALSARLGVLYRDLRTLSDSLMDSRDRQVSVWNRVTQRFVQADSMIDWQLQAGVDPRDPNAVIKLNTLSDLESDLTEVAFEVGVWLGNDEKSREQGLDRLIRAKAEEFRTGIGRLRSLPLDPAEVRWVAAVSHVFEGMMAAIAPVLELERRLRRERDQLLDVREEIDRLLDEEIQALSRERLQQPRLAAENTAFTVLQRIRWLVPLVLLVAVTMAVVLIRTIERPVRRLKAGAEAVGAGDLGHRIILSGNDEFSDVAGEFNRMVEQLQATTVSKGLLERSEERLKESVEQLREEIAERVRSQAERSRLEASLRRTETMSAMGALVAGVAHEVRNPLFGILSVLDAMEARFSSRHEFQRFLAVLREQADRLNRLMRDLLEYGKPPTRELAPASVADVLTEALNCTGPAAERSGVRLVSAIEDGRSPVTLDRNRLLRVFVNLLENAIDHTPPGGTVAVECRVVSEPQDRWIQCTVSDTGPGFRGDDLTQVFQPFFTRRKGGTGLGLSIAQQIVEEHQGQITAANRPEGGAIVTVSLPGPQPQMVVAADAHAEA